MIFLLDSAALAQTAQLGKYGGRKNKFIDNRKRQAANFRTWDTFYRTDVSCFSKISVGVKDQKIP